MQPLIWSLFTSIFKAVLLNLPPKVLFKYGCREKAVWTANMRAIYSQPSTYTELTVLVNLQVFPLTKTMTKHSVNKLNDKE